MRPLLLAAFMLASCDHPVCDLADVPRTGPNQPSEEHYIEIVGRILEMISEARGPDIVEAHRWYCEIGGVNFTDAPWDSPTGRYIGVYHIYSAEIEVYAPDPGCIAVTALPHEILHHFQFLWRGYANDDAPGLFGRPDGLEYQIIRDTARMCQKGSYQ